MSRNLCLPAPAGRVFSTLILALTLLCACGDGGAPDAAPSSGAARGSDSGPYSEAHSEARSGTRSGSGRQTDTQSAGRVEGRGADTENWAGALPRPEWKKFTRVLPSVPWFEVYRITPRIHAIYEPSQFEEVISYLIEGDDFALLFDTGLGIGRIKDVVDQLTDRQLIVLNSHSHYDHVGGNHEFLLIAALDTAYGLARAGGASGPAIAETVSPAWVAGPFPPGFSPEAYKIHPWAPSSTVADGDVIDLGGIALEVMHLPGHSPDSLALFDRGNRQIFVGDIFYLAPLYAHLEGSNLTHYRASAERLAALVPQLDAVYTGHNVPVVAPSYLDSLAAAFRAIADQRTDYIITDEAREYDFGDFSILVPDHGRDNAQAPAP